MQSKSPKCFIHFIFLCYSYVLLCHPYVICMHLYAIRMLFVCGFNINLFKSLVISIIMREMYLWAFPWVIVFPWHNMIWRLMLWWRQELCKECFVSSGGSEVYWNVLVKCNSLQKSMIIVPLHTQIRILQSKGFKSLKLFINNALHNKTCITSLDKVIRTW